MERINGLRATKRLATCAIAIAELLYSDRNPDEIQRSRDRLARLPYLALSLEAERRIPEVMQALAGRGWHRMPVPDLLLAATAEVHSAVLLHYDSDYERIAEVTGQPHEWIIPRGTGHRNTD